jgi:transcriptional regulator with XRE-family HTH domain
VRRPTRIDGQRSQIGVLLADLRAARGLTLRQVEGATGHAVSNAYLSQLEKGKVQKPSPNVLQVLAAVYAVPYESLMEKAGYLLASRGRKGKRRRGRDVLAIDNLTVEEEEDLLKYLAFLRYRKPARRVREGGRSDGPRRGRASAPQRVEILDTRERPAIN